MTLIKRLTNLIPDVSISYLAIFIVAAITFAGLSKVSHTRLLPHLTYYASTGPVTSMDSNGSVLWCGTRFGLVRWDTDSMTYDIIRTPDVLPHASIADIDVAPDGALWLATSENGVACFDGTSWQSYSTGDGLPSLNGLSIHAAENGTVYAGVYQPGPYDEGGGGLSSFDGDSWTSTQYSFDRMDGKNFLYDITTDPDGVVWTACSGQLTSVVDSTWTFYDINATRVLFDTKGTLWVHTGTGISQSTDGSFENIDLPDGFHGNNIVALVAAPNGGVLILTKYGGLLAAGKDSVMSILVNEGDESLFTAITVDESGIVWAGLNNGGIAQFEDGVWTMFTLDEPMFGGALYTVCSDKNGNLWTVTDNGLFRLVDSTWELIVPGDKIANHGNDPDFSLFFDSNGKLWLLGYYNGEKNIRYFDNGDFVSNPVINVYGGVFRAVPDIGDGMWLNFRNKQNLYRYENGSLSEISSPESIDDTLLPIAVDCEGGVWCITRNEYNQSLYCYKNGLWESHQEVYRKTYESGVTGMDFGPDGSVWVSVIDNCGTTHWPIYKSRILNMLINAEQFTEVHSVDTGSVLHSVDKEGRLWLSRYGFEDSDYYGTHYYGVIRFNGDTATMMREPEGLPDDRIRDIFVDIGNSIWIVTDNGIMRYIDETTSVAGQSISPSLFNVITAYPNPFNPSTTIGFTLPRPGLVSAVLYSVTGQKVRTFVSKQMDEGYHHIVWDGLDGDGNPSSSGIYCVRVSSGNFHTTGKITLIR